MYYIALVLRECWIKEFILRDTFIEASFALAKMSKEGVIPFPCRTRKLSLDGQYVTVVLQNTC